MKIALFSNIHGNLPALEAVLCDIDKHKPDEIYCLGDLVNYAPWTNEIIDMLRERNVPVIKGNHDEGVGNHSSFSFYYDSEEERKAGLKAIAFTNSKITAENREYLKTLPKSLRLDTGDHRSCIHTLLTHGSPESIIDYIEEDHNAGELLEILDAYTIDIFITGQSHVPYHRFLFSERNKEQICRHVIGVGSVGKPKDSDMRAAWCSLELTEKSSVYDPDSIQVQIHRVRYDWDYTIKAITRSKVPNIYAEQLSQFRHFNA